jgi:hypothetical protein
MAERLAGRGPQSRIVLARALTIAVVVGGLSVAAADVGLLRRDAETMKRKVDTIASRGDLPGHQRAQTVVTEQELNAYLAYEMASDLPAGVVNPTVALLGNNRVAGHATVDLDQVSQARRSSSPFDPLSFLSGKMPVELTGTVTAAEGKGSFQFESASFAGAPVPKLILQQLVSYYSRSPEHPSGISLDEAFALPASIREIRLERGQAIVVQ